MEGLTKKKIFFFWSWFISEFKTLKFILGQTNILFSPWNKMPHWAVGEAKAVKGWIPKIEEVSPSLPSLCCSHPAGARLQDVDGSALLASFNWAAPSQHLPSPRSMFSPWLSSSSKGGFSPWCAWSPFMREEEPMPPSAGNVPQRRTFLPLPSCACMQSPATSLLHAPSSVLFSWSCSVHLVFQILGFKI